MAESIDRCRWYRETTITNNGNGHGHQVIKGFECLIKPDTPYCNGFNKSCPRNEPVNQRVPEPIK